MKTIIIADDHPATLSGVKLFLERMDYHILGTYDNGIQACNNILSLQPDYAILDLSMPGMNGLEVLEKVKRTSKMTKIIIYTMYHEKALYEKAKQLDVNGYLLKDFAMEELESCFSALQTSHQWFSPKLHDTLILKSTDSMHEKIILLTAAERKILSMVAEEKSSKTISELLFISEKTVENHRSHIIRKLGLSQHKNALLIWALENKASLQFGNSFTDSPDNMF